MTTGVGTQTLGQMTVENKTFYELKMLKVATGPFLHSWFAQEGGVFPVFSLPENEGDVIQWSKPAALSNVTDPLTEAVTPEPLDMTITVLSTTVYEYGAYIRYSRKLSQMGKQELPM
jgi:N4-gp56 family major capsid protein